MGQQMRKLAGKSLAENASDRVLCSTTGSQFHAMPTPQNRNNRSLDQTVQRGWIRLPNNTCLEVAKYLEVTVILARCDSYLPFFKEKE